MKHKEIKVLITKQMLFVYFIPTVLGCVCCITAPSSSDFVQSEVIYFFLLQRVIPQIHAYPIIAMKEASTPNPAPVNKI